MFSWRSLWGCALLLLPSLAAAQTINGVLLQADSVTPAGGVIVVASRPADDSILARTITSGNGRYYLSLRAGLVRLRALRIGHRPFVVATLTLGANETRALRTVLHSTPIVLSAITTRGSTACRQTGAAGEAVATVFEEARKALISTKLTSRDARPLFRISHFTELRSFGNRAMSPRRHEFSEGESLRPFQSLPPDLLARVGYLETDDAGVTTYWAPDADVLLSAPFAAGHCMDLISGTGDRTGWIGLTFRPEARPAGLVDVRGTLWLDRGSSELRRMEYWYVGLAPEMTEANPGGTIEFTRLTDGFWFISAWEIRMPRLLPQMGRVRVVAVDAQGAEVWRVRRGNDLVFTNGEEEPPPKTAARSGGTQDAARGEAGQEHPDTVLNTSRCEQGAKGATVALLHGFVRDERGGVLGDAVVTVEWPEQHKVTGGRLSWQTRQLTTVTASDGYFAVCGVPHRQLMTVVAQFGARAAPKAAVRLDGDEQKARVDLRVAGARDGNARGVVVRVRDRAGHAIPHALVEVENGRGRVSDDSGMVRLAVAPDSLRLIARRIGFATFTGKVGRDAAGEFPVQLLGIVPASGTATVPEATASPLERAGFYDRLLRAQRGAFAGDFVTPEELEMRNGARVSDLLSGRRLVDVTHTRGLRARTYAIGRRGCKMTVLLDGRMLVPEDGIVAIDNVVDARMVAAMEIYVGAATVPAALMPLAGAVDLGTCGLVAIWTGERR